MMEGTVELVNSVERQFNRNLLETGFDSDVLILARWGAQVPCHERFLLGSPVLKAMLEQLDTPNPVPGSNMVASGGLYMPVPLLRGKTKKIIEMEKWSTAEVNEFLSFLYCRETPQAWGNGSLAIALYEMGEEYQVPGLIPLMSVVLGGMPLEHFEDEDAARLFAIASGMMMDESLPLLTNASTLGVLDLVNHELEEKAIKIFERASAKSGSLPGPGLEVASKKAREEPDPKSSNVGGGGADLEVDKTGMRMIPKGADNSIPGQSGAEGDQGKEKLEMEAGSFKKEMEEEVTDQKGGCSNEEDDLYADAMKDEDGELAGTLNGGE